jgi:glutamate synthase domain-containing protein 2
VPRRETAEAGAEADAVASAKAAGASDDAPRRQSDTRETLMADIHRMAETGESILEPMRTEPPGFTWDDLLIVGAQLARIPLDADVPVRTETVIGPAAAKPLVLDTPILVSHMSFGALSREVKLALAKGSAAVGAGMCSGEGGILPESIEAAHRYVFEIVPRGYSLTEENLRRADALEIKIGQSAKPGLGGHLPGEKVTDEVAAVRGVEPGKSVTSPAAFPDIRSAEDLAAKIAWLRETSGGRPVGVKLAAGDIEADLAVALEGNPDFVTIDGRPGATGAAPKVVKAATSVPTLFALHRARRFLDEQGATGVSLIVTGGLRVSSDFAKALALGGGRGRGRHGRADRRGVSAVPRLPHGPLSGRRRDAGSRAPGPARRRGVRAARRELPARLHRGAPGLRPDDRERRCPRAVPEGIS